VAGEVADDGVGFDVQAMLERTRPGHLGLAAMRDRADLAGGWCQVDSGQGGTAVKFWIPDRLSGGNPQSGAAGH
jgi:signal transduction histidine kinase